jgi:hypothetical protein
VTRRLVGAASRLASLIVLPGDLRRLRHERDVWEHLALRSTCTLHRYVEHHEGLPRDPVTPDLRCREVLLYARPRGPNMAAMDATSSALASIGVALRRPQECRLPPLPGTVPTFRLRGGWGLPNLVRRARTSSSAGWHCRSPTRRACARRVRGRSGDRGLSAGGGHAGRRQPEEDHACRRRPRRGGVRPPRRRPRWRHDVDRGQGARRRTSSSRVSGAGAGQRSDPSLGPAGPRLATSMP